MKNFMTFIVCVIIFILSMIVCVVVGGCDFRETTVNPLYAKKPPVSTTKPPTLTAEGRRVETITHDGHTFIYVRDTIFMHHPGCPCLLPTIEPNK